MALPPIRDFRNPFESGITPTGWTRDGDDAVARYGTSGDKFKSWYARNIGILIQMIRRIRADVSEEELLQAIATRNFDSIIEKIEARARYAYGEIIAQTYNDSVTDLLDWTKNLRLIQIDQVSIIRDQVNIRTQARNESNAMELVREFVNDQRQRLDQETGLRFIGERIRDTARPGEFLGQRPTEVAERTFNAKQLKRRIGLTYYQWRSVDKVEALLRDQDYDGLRRFRTNEYGIRVSNRPLFDDDLMALVEPYKELTAAGNYKAMPESVIRRIVDQYTDNKIVSRLETIARTEMLRNVNAGKYDANEMMIERGDIQRDWQTKVWDSSLDNRVRVSHKYPLHGQVFGSLMLGAYLTNDGNTCLYPCDPSLPPEDSINCRCQEIYELRIPVNDLLAHVPGIDEAFPL